MDSFLSDAREFLPILLQGVWLTILITAGSLVVSTVFALVATVLTFSSVAKRTGR